MTELGYERTSRREDSISLALAKFEKNLATIDSVKRWECVEFDVEKDKGRRLMLSLILYNY